MHIWALAYLKFGYTTALKKKVEILILSFSFFKGRVCRFSSSHHGLFLRHTPDAAPAHVNHRACEPHARLTESDALPLSGAGDNFPWSIAVARASLGTLMSSLRLHNGLIQTLSQSSYPLIVMKSFSSYLVVKTKTRRKGHLCNEVSLYSDHGRITAHLEVNVVGQSGRSI